jgi:hypothetical protein
MMMMVVKSQLTSSSRSAHLPHTPPSFLVLTVNFHLLVHATQSSITLITLITRTDERTNERTNELGNCTVFTVRSGYG